MASSRPLDRIDFALIALLQKNARRSNKELAARVGLAPSSCLERVRRLEREGVIQGWHALVDPRAVGVGLQALVMIQLGVHRRESFEAFADHLRELPELVRYFALGGAWDFLVHLAVRDSEHLRAVTLEGIASREEVRHFETVILFEHVRAPAMPQYPPAEEERSSRSARTGR